MIKKHEPKSFTIDRARWLTGRDHVSALYDRTSRRMCCLGFYARACKLQTAEITNMASPANVLNPGVHKLPLWLFNLHTTRFGSVTGQEDRNSILVGQLMSVNDARELTNKEREAQVKQLFAEAGVKVTFKGRYRKPIKFG